MEHMEQEITIDLREVFQIIRKRAGIIISITMLSALISSVLSFFIIPPTYEAKTSIIIGKTQDAKNSQQMQYNDVMMYQKLVKTYSEIAKSRLVAEKTAAKIGGELTPEELMENITVTPQADTQIMVIKSEGREPELVMNMVNTLAQTFISESKTLYPSGTVQIMDEANLPKAPIKPRAFMNIAIALFLGMMVSLGIVFLLEYMDNTIKTEDDINKYLELPVVGIIPKMSEN